MPLSFKILGLIANFVLGLVFAIITIAGTNTLNMAFVLGLISAFFFYNFSVFLKMRKIYSEEEYLKSEVRKMELRRKLGNMGHPGFSDIVDKDNRSEPPQN